MLETLTPYIAYSAALFIAAGIPGPGIAALVGRAMGSSTAATLPFILGLALGDLVFLTLAVAGLAFIAQAFGEVFLVIKIAGGLYLLYLAYSFWTSGIDPQSVRARRVKQPLAAIGGGFLVTLGNPKTIIFYGALLPNVIDLAQVDVTRWAILSVLTVVVLFVTLTPYVLATTKAASLLSSSVALKRLNRGAAMFIGGAGAVILIEAAMETVRQVSGARR
jgi:threonine/homoserine/homoserine lactone efflux protein